MLSVKGYEGDACDNDFDECASDPCQNGGTCGDSSSDESIDIDAFKCTCPYSWHGETCGTQDDMCASNPCQNGATCDSDEDSDGNAIFVCTCTAGFGGDDCGSESVCNSNDGSAPTCQNGGVCKDDPNAELKYTCDCGDSGYNGAHCETNTDDCDDGTEARNDCQNGIKEDGSLDTHGTCVDAINAHTCTCHPGFSGDTCTDHKSECDAQKPCQNGGECTDDASNNDGYTCACADGFSGPTCGNGEDTDDCAVDGGTPCLNGAECVDGDDDYTCKCNDGDLEGGIYAGKNCEACEDGKQPNEDHTACQNCPAGKAGAGGTCVDCDDGTEQSHDHVSCVACAAGTGQTNALLCLVTATHSTLTWDRVCLQRRLSRARGSVRPASRARRRWRMRRCVASLLARRPRHLAADNALLRSSDGHVAAFAHSFLCLCPHQHRLASQEVRVLVRANFHSANFRAASDPIVLTDLRCVVLGRAAQIAWGSSTVPTGKHARPAKPGSTLTPTTLPATSVHRSVRDKPSLLTRRATHLK